MTLNNENNNECCKCTTPEIYIELNQQGPQGRQGNPGVDGVSPEITVAQNTNTSYVLKIEDVNGSFTTPNLKATLPVGGQEGTVLTKNSSTDGDVSWQILPNASQENPGMVELATIEDMTPDDSGEINDLKAVTPDLLAGYVEQEINNITPYTLPIASTTTLGGVKPDGTTITIDTDGTIHGASTYTLPQATDTILGGVKAEAKQDTDIQPVRIDTATGLLYTAAGGGGTIEYIDGGNAQTDEPAVLKASNVDLGVYPTNNIYSTNENITIE